MTLNCRIKPSIGLGQLFAGVSALLFLSFAGPGVARAADPVISTDVLDPRPIYEQRPAVEGINFKVSAVTGVIGGYANHMIVASVATPFPFFDQFGAQLDLGIGNYRSDYISSAAALHLFWRDPSIGMFGIYGDWGYVNPEHGGRVAFESSLYFDRWTLDVLSGVQFGQHFETKFIDEIDLSYYFTDNLKGSIGHRLISRGNVANVGFEFMPQGYNGWSVYGEAEAGEDGYSGAWAGVRFSFGTGGANSLMERDRTADPMVRIPRNLASVTQCGELAVPKPQTWWRTEQHNLCGSADDIANAGGIISKQ